MSEGNQNEQVQEESPIQFSVFLSSTPPNTKKKINSLNNQSHLSEPSVLLYCDSALCERYMLFDIKGDSDEIVLMTNWTTHILRYKCRHCEKSEKVFAVRVMPYSTDFLGPKTGEAVKLGEWPPYGPPTPSRLLTLIKPDRELFLQGRRAEINGLGIGAYAYYRRVVFNQWRLILDEIIKVAKRLKVDSGDIAKLEKARNERQFGRAVDEIKDVIPQALLIEGHNPIDVLYKATSLGLHEGTDAECLDRAESIRILLAALTEKVNHVLKKETAVKKALTKIFGEPKKAQDNNPD